MPALLAMRQTAAPNWSGHASRCSWGASGLPPCRRMNRSRTSVWLPGSTFTMDNLVSMNRRLVFASSL